MKSNTEVNSEFKKFDSAMRKVALVSKEELQRREEEWKREKEVSGQRKTTPRKSE